MDYKEIVRRINESEGSNRFSKSDDIEINYLKTLNLPNEVADFYVDNNPIDIIDINNVRLLPILEIIEENTNYTPGHLLSPLGYSVIASTIEGDVYCVRYTANEYSIVLASHDEIYEGQESQEIIKGTKKVAETFGDFLNSFVERRLVANFYHLED